MKRFFDRFGGIISLALIAAIVALAVILDVRHGYPKAAKPRVPTLAPVLAPLPTPWPTTPSTAEATVTVEVAPLPTPEVAPLPVRDD